MGNIQKNLGDIDDLAFAEEMERAMKPGGGGGDGGRLRDHIIEQRHLPQGPVRMRILPPTQGMRMPWVRFDQHKFWNESNRQFAAFNCLQRMGGGICPACNSFIPKLENLVASGRYPAGAKQMLEGGKAKTQLAMNVLIVNWCGDPPPPEMQGVKVFKFGTGIWRGTAKGQVGGLMRVLDACRTLSSPGEDGVDVIISKHGKGLDTVYGVDMATTEGTVQIGTRTVKQQVPDYAPLGKGRLNIDDVMKQRHDLSAFTRMKSEDEILDLIKKVDTFSVQPSRPLGKTAQEEIEEDFPPF